MVHLNIMSKNTSIILGNHFDQFIQNEIKEGRYSSASEIIRNGLRLLEHERNIKDRLDDALVVGLESGTPKVFDNEDFKKRMRAKHAE
jgi:antitoxin ParD1/3/4